ncbi:MAG: SPOR domain-containing protein [Candidatus Omnitrophica bacterium]|nr:SPOR domain-containing protein [Candidatus Omnitrophota bacterium]
MSKERSSQLELFSEHDNSDHLVAKPVDSGFLDYVKLYEKAILVTIGFLLTGIVAFCLGVERGKTCAISSVGARFDVGGQKDEQAPTNVISSKRENPKVILPQSQNSGLSFSIKGQLKNMPVKQEIIIPESPAQQDKSAYTIQIATYQARDGAEKEMVKLRQKGFSPLVMKKGSYNVVCVGTFNNKETARSLLTQLKSKYRDCYIRRL